MNPLVTAALISSAANFAGNFFGGGGSEGLSNADQRWLADFQWKQSLRQEELQKDLAYNGIAIRVRDAANAGLSPLAAIGVPSSGGSPVMTAFSGSPQVNEPSMGRRVMGGLSDMGQNITRAILSTKSADEHAIAKAELEKVKAETDFVRAQAAESLARTAELGKVKPVVPAAQNVQMPDGTVVEGVHPDVATAYMSDPMLLWGNSISSAVRRMYQGSYSLGKNLVGPVVHDLVHPVDRVRRK